MERIRRRYTKAFKLKIMEEIRDGKFTSAYHAGRMYGIRPRIIYRWMDQLGFSHLKSTVMEIKTMNEIDEVKLLKQEIKKLKLALAEETLSRQIEHATAKVAAEMAGIKLEDLKKKLAPHRPNDGGGRRGRGRSRRPSAAPHRAGRLPEVRQDDGLLLR